MPDKTEWAQIGRRSRMKGKNRQRELLHFLEEMFGIPSPEGVDLQKMGDEEAWSHLPVRVELKAGAQVATTAKRYHECRTQYDRHAADERPFLMAIRPDGERTNYFMMSGRDLITICELYWDAWGGNALEDPE